MPVDFLTEEQEERYGRFLGEPSPEQLDKYFHLASTDRELIAARRGDHNRLGFAVQLGTVRFLGTFLPDPTGVPPGVVRYMAGQLGVNAECLGAYGDSERRWDHTVEIREHFGYRDFTDAGEYFGLLRWLYARAWVSSQGPSMLFDLATTRLVARKILLPGVTTLARLVARVRDRASARLWKKLSTIPSRSQRERLESLVQTDGTRQTALDRLRRPPTRCSATGVAGALRRLREVRELGVHHLELGRLPPARVAALARFAGAARVQAIQRMPDERRTATLFAFAHTLARTACDDALDAFDVFVVTAFARAENRGETERLKTLKDLDQAALTLREACLVFLDPECEDLAAARETLYERIPKARIDGALSAVSTLARAPDDQHYYERVLRGYSNLQQFLPLLLETVPCEATEAGRPILDALAAACTLKHRPRLVLVDDEGALVPPVWRRHVFPKPGVLDRYAYTFCLLEQLREALHRRDVFVNDSTRWSDPRRLLLEGDAWEAARPTVCRALGRDPTPERALRELSTELDQAYRWAAENLGRNPSLRVETDARGRDALVLTPLDALPEPQSLGALREAAHALLPQVGLPDLLLEVATWTGFPAEFTHASEGLSRVEDLDTSLCAVLLAESCNIGLEPVIEPGVPALTRGRLSWVSQNYLRGETLVRANARLVNYQTKIPLAQAWGGGEIASADGIRFTVPVRTINARPSPKYFNRERGVTYYNFRGNQDMGFHGIVVPGTVRDAPYSLNGLLEHQTSLRPTQLMTDTGSYTDLVFGLFWLLGFRFSPRLADLKDARLWRMDRSAHYGPLNGVARNRINTKLAAANWDDFLRVAGSLLSGRVSASELIRALQAGGRLTTLARAIAEVGRVAKTIHILTFVDDESYRRLILLQLNRHEGRHSLARTVFHGQRGELRQRYREGQEDQLGALGLVLNAVVLWNTRYLDTALGQLRQQGFDVRDEDVERLSPLAHEHINLLGRYHFGLPDSVRKGELRKLRDPKEAADR
jgi:TnpA family transposase